MFCRFSSIRRSLGLQRFPLRRLAACACRFQSEEIRPEDVSFADDSSVGGESGPTSGGGPSLVASFGDVPELDQFSRARVLNFIKRFTAAQEGAGPKRHERGKDSGGETPFEIREVRIEDATHYLARIKIPFGEPYGTRFGEGLSANSKDSETLAAMHAETIIDSLGFQLYTLPSMQRKHAESRRNLGRWAPMPEDSPRSPTEVPTPRPLRRIMDRDETEDGKWQLLEARSLGYTTPSHTMLSPAIVDPNAQHRIRILFRTLRKNFDEALTIEETPHSCDSSIKMFDAIIRIPLPPAYGRVEARGRALDRQLAIVLASMHCELIVDALGFPLYPDSVELQAQHATTARNFGRWAPLPEDQFLPPGTPIPLPLKQLIIVPTGAARVSEPSPDETLVLHHRQLADESTNYTAVTELVSDAPRLLIAFLAHRNYPRLDPFFTERVGNVFRATVVLPVDPQLGVRGGVGIGSNPAEAQVLCAMHAIEVINLVGDRLFADDVEQTNYVEKRKRSGLTVPDETEPMSARARRSSPAALRRVLSPSCGAPQSVPRRQGGADKDALRQQVREYRLQQMEAGKSHSDIDVSVAKRHSLRQRTGSAINYKVQQARVEKHHWSLEADTGDGFIIVSPAQKMDNSASFGHTMVSPRQLDLLARERIVGYLAEAGRRSEQAFRTEKVETHDAQTFHRCEIALPVPDAYGERIAVGEAPESRDAECLAAMHAELTLDCLGLPLYTDPAKQRKHAESARNVGRYAPMPSESPQPTATLSPPKLRKEREDSIRWLKHVQKAAGIHSRVQLDSDVAAREKREAELSTFDVITAEQIDLNSKARVQNYLRRTLKAPEVVEHKIEASATSVNHTCRLVVPVPSQYGERVATGMALSKKEAEALCYMHAERIIDALGIKLFNLPGLQTRHAERVRKEGRWAPLPSEKDTEKPAETPSPAPFRIDQIGPKPKYPLPPKLAAVTPRIWREYVKACEDYIEEKKRHERERAFQEGKVPMTGNTLVDEALAEVESMEAARQVKNDLYQYCFRANLTYPTYWRTQAVGPQTGRLVLTSVEVPGYEHIRALGLGKNKSVSSRKAAMHVMAILRRLDPDFAHHEFGTSAAEAQDQQQATKKKNDQGSWDKISGSFTYEGKTRLIEMYTVCNGLPPPRIIHKQRHEGPFVIYSTVVEVEDTDGMRYVGRAQQTGHKMNATAAYDEVFAKMVRSIPAFRSLMQLLKRHPHLDPEHVMSISIPKYIENKIKEVTEGMDEVCDDTELAPTKVEDPSSQSLAKRFAVDPAAADHRSVMLKSRLASRLVNPKYLSDFHPRRSTLSIHDKKKEILETIAENPVTVICGTTGCGKTTQLPQYLLDEAAEKGQGGKCSIVVTQPRRITAISIAQRVAAERLEFVGDEIGYAIRLESRPGKSVNFCTSGILLRLFQASPDLDGVSHVIVDEIHERDINSDFLLILLKELVRRRPDIRVILMSATLQSELFSAFFAGAPTINVEGYVYPVKEMYLEDIAEAAKEKGVVAPSFKAALAPPPGEHDESELPPHKLQKQRYGFSEAIEPIDLTALVFAVDYVTHSMDFENSSILVFLPGWDDIVRAREQLSTGRFHIIALHSSISSEEQLMCFRPAPPGKVKLVLSTNIAESGVTIDDVGAVIDLGRAKEKSFVMRRGRTSVGRNEFGSMSQLVTIFASRANCIQRRGRAGRTKEGLCIRLYTRKHWNELPDFQVPEMLRQPLDSLCLQILALNLGDPAEFLQKALEPPPVESIESAMERLRNLGATSEDRQLTALGARLAQLPVMPRVGKMILLGAVLQCLDSVLTIAAAMDVDPFISHRDYRDIVRVHREELACNSQSDHVAVLNAYNLWAAAVALKTAQEVTTVIGENMLHLQSLRVITKYKRQFFDILAASGFVADAISPKNAAQPTFVDDSSYSTEATDIGLVKGVICAGMFPNVALFREKKVYRNKLDNLISPHPSSVVNKLAFEKITNPYFVYEELVRSPTDIRVFFRGITNVSMWAILLLGTSNLHITYREDLNLGVIDDWIVFRATVDSLEMMKRLKQRLNLCISKKFLSPGDSENNETLAKLKEIIQLLCNLPTRPNDLVSTVWEEHGAITEAVVATTGPAKEEAPSEQATEEGTQATVLDEESGPDAIKGMLNFDDIAGHMATEEAIQGDLEAAAKRVHEAEQQARSPESE